MPNDNSVAPRSGFVPLSKLPNFDPRHVPVAGVDAHLPAVPLARLQAQALRQRFIAPPAWRPEIMGEGKYAERATMHASVLVPIVLRNEPMVLLTERTAHLSTHSGQIAFPGGKADAGDANEAATALREAEEEVGLDRRFVQVLGNLPVYVTGSSFIITPVIALVQPGFAITPNVDEVAAVFEVPLAFLMDPANHRRHHFEWNGVRREWFSMPYIEPGAPIASPMTALITATQPTERFIWGATAGMLRNFYRFLAA